MIDLEWAKESVDLRAVGVSYREEVRPARPDLDPPKPESHVVSVSVGVDLGDEFLKACYRTIWPGVSIERDRFTPERASEAIKDALNLEVENLRAKCSRIVRVEFDDEDRRLIEAAYSLGKSLEEAKDKAIVESWRRVFVKHGRPEFTPSGRERPHYERWEANEKHEYLWMEFDPESVDRWR